LTVVLSALGFILYFVIKFDADMVLFYGKLIGLASSILTLTQWIPQIYTTWILQQAGSLSLPMLFIQLPGSILVIYFQIIVGSDLTTWFPYVVTFLSQGILIAMCFYFMFKSRCPPKISPDESDRLL